MKATELQAGKDIDKLVTDAVKTLTRKAEEARYAAGRHALSSLRKKEGTAGKAEDRELALMAEAEAGAYDAACRIINEGPDSLRNIWRMLHGIEVVPPVSPT